ncbi:MAG: radical SAM protein [Deltaproteobacteria bacterium]|nr:radical SAM protein [Deltaproteobacteria bacterium]
MKVLLIYVVTENINIPVLPLGMACIAASVEHAGHEVRQVSLTSQHARSELETVVGEFIPDVIGVSLRNVDDQKMESTQFLLGAVKEAISFCRTLTEAPIILGGAGYSIFPDSALSYLEADMGIQGAGEESFVKLLECIKEKKELNGIPGLFIPETEPLQTVAILDNPEASPLPLPNRHLQLAPAVKERKTMIPFQTGRGCPMNCNYCSTPAIEGVKPRHYSADKVIGALSKYVEDGFNHFFFVDNTFNLPGVHAAEICDRIIAEGLDISWQCIFYPWNVDEALIEKMAGAGCTDVSLGFESGSEKILSIMNKRFRPEEVRRISKMLKRNGIRQMGFLLLGGPGETKETVEESLVFAESLELNMMKLTLGIRIYPNTPLAKTALEDGIITADQNLLFPAFYMVPELEAWLREMVNKRLDGRPNWIY